MLDPDAAEARAQPSLMLRQHVVARAPALLMTSAVLALLLYRGASFSRARSSSRKYDLVILGATGYVGSLLTASLFGDRDKFLSLTKDAALNGGTDGVRFALAGSDEAWAAPEAVCHRGI